MKTRELVQKALKPYLHPDANEEVIISRLMSIVDLVSEESYSDGHSAGYSEGWDEGYYEGEGNCE